VNASRDQILSSPRSAPVPFDVPEWGGVVYLKILSVADQQAISEGVAPADVPVRLLVHALVDEHGHRLLEDADALALADQEFPLVMRVFAEAARLNGMTTDEFDEAMASFEKGASTRNASASLSLSGFPQGNSRSG